MTSGELLKLTNGIVQGMSGSPIIQNGKIIGAVTHVFVDDSTCGYGIFIDRMLDKDEKLIKKRIMIRWKERNLAADLDSYL